ncbi:MAG: dipeptide epimerase [Bacteroidetes bacterium]|nr:MAG: dipeptide epimerase [Bacteroidota bacterium]
MRITKIAVYKFSIPMHPFTIATGTMEYAQNIFIRVFIEDGSYGVGECSAFPMIVGETQATCYELAKDFAGLWKKKDARDIEGRMTELHQYTAFNNTIKSAFDMALHDIAAKQAGQPLYAYLGGKLKSLETDLTIGIDSPSVMAEIALEFKSRGVRIIKIKLGKNAMEDVERVRLIRTSVGPDPILRIDANQGWNFEEAAFALQEIGHYQVQFCEQPMRYWDDDKLPALKKISPIPIMADESVFSHFDAKRLIQAKACDYINIKLAKSGGIFEAGKINEVCEQNQIYCMMGGMLESRLALTAFAHFAIAHNNIIFYDMDTCMLGHKIDPVVGGVKYNKFFLDIPASNGIGADADEGFLEHCEHIMI